MALHYHFTDVPTFKAMAANGEFLEWAHVFGHRYGTPKGPVEAELAAAAMCCSISTGITDCP